MPTTTRTTMLHGSRLLLGGVVVLATGLLVVGTPAVAADGTRADGAARESWWSAALKLDQAHQEVTGRGVNIAVVDSGLDPGIPEIADADISFGKTHCTSRPSLSKASSGAAGDHGSAMTSLIVGGGNGADGPGTGIMGVAPDATVRFYDNDSDPDAEGNQCGVMSETAATIRQAVDDGADIVNLSFAGPETTVGQRILDKLVKRDVVLVAAAGTRGGGDEVYEYPGATPGVVTVNAVDRDAKAWSENPRLFGGDPQFGYPVISAPGVEVEAPGVSDGGSSSNGVRSGTSDATAIVSGLLALVKEKYPDATANQLIQHLIHNPGGDVGYAWDADYGFGIASATNMLKSDPQEWPDENPLVDGPKRALADFPMSVRGKAEPSESGSPTAQSSDVDSGSSDVDETSGTPAGTGGGLGVGAWLGLGAAVFVVGGAGAFVAARRRGSSSTAGSRATGSVTEGE